MEDCRRTIFQHNKMAVSFIKNVLTTNNFQKQVRNTFSFFFFFLRILVSFWSIYTFNGLECLFKKKQFRSSHRRCEGVKVCNFIKKRLQRRCFPVKFEKFLGTSILTKICERLPLSTIAFVLNFERATVWFKHLLLHKWSPKIYFKKLLVVTYLVKQ